MIAVCAALAAVCVMWALKRRRDSRLLRKSLEAQEREFRFERFDVLWRPVVSYVPDLKAITRVRAGVPHCKACAVPLSAASGGGWACPRCKTAYRVALEDLTVVDAVTREALRSFQELNKDYKVT